MHELSLVTSIIDTVLEAAPPPSSPGEHIVSLEVEVGEMTGALPELMQQAYRQATADLPVLKDAHLILRSIPVTATCDDCGTTYHPSKENDYRCPSCGSIASKITAGRGLTVKKINYA